MSSNSISPAETESRLYRGWETAGAFAAGGRPDAAPFTVMIPPPNVTGSLHMGHALTFTLQDTLIRWRRMQGRDALWQPGTDHAGIATQMVVERLLDGEGTSRKALGREAFLERVWRWKAESGGAITQQLRRLGASLDWRRERFTMDEGLSAAVREVFVGLYEKGLIYRDYRLVNWDPKLGTAISDLEVESREVKGNLWYIRYPIVSEGERFITVATTRPETMLGDIAIAVHPGDARYRDLIGRYARLPLVSRLIPIIADEYSDPTKGTGAVKITPAHDFNDWEVAQRHPTLPGPVPSVIDTQGRITLAEIHLDPISSADRDFLRSLDGMDRFAARGAIVAELERNGLLEKIEPHTHQVPHGDRSGVPIEPLRMVQWFCNAAELAKPAIAAVERGETVFVPKQWENTFFAWMRNIEPWCISRQLWWGHRIPAWYAENGAVFVARDAASAAAAARQKFGIEVTLTQDEDVLDTWFSSALWPFSTLGWPEQTPMLARHYPGDVLVTGFDIIFFWVARMMMMGLHFMGDVPFRTVYIHGLVRDERGQKMSKSKGNVIDPLALIDEFGADALRFAICALTGPGRDIKLGRARVENYRSFVTKLRNAARFCEINGVVPVPDFDPATAGLPLSRWILDAANTAIAEAGAALEAYRFDEYAAACYRFTWNIFCDWFVEFAKPIFAEPAFAEQTRAVAAHVLGVILRLLHPAMPFVTEELWDRFGYGPKFSLIVAPWPQPRTVNSPEDARQQVETVIRLISEIRAVRAEMNVPPATLVPILLRSDGNTLLLQGPTYFATLWREQICRMARASEIRTLMNEAAPAGSVQILLDNFTVLLPLAGVVDFAVERARLQREFAKADQERDKHLAKLSNDAFTSRAPTEVVEDVKERLSAAARETRRLRAALDRIPQT